MANVPYVYTATQVAKRAQTLNAYVDKGTPKERWVPMRGLRPQYLGLITRLKAAWKVFSGKGDVVIWEA